ncbi:MAG: hypothetical protein P9F19_05390 [Candidatus Contendobacter sp.]|nr:hypothetical protein [Candidatus Contendobacter sp.]
MKLSAAVTVIWKLAMHEAVRAAFREIEPEHFLAAVLKFSELPALTDLQDPGGAEVARQLAVEIAAVRGELARRNLDGTTLRRRLRARLGKGVHLSMGEAPHRSAASRALFAQVAQRALERREPCVTATLLLEALWATPTPAMIEVMGNAIAAPVRALSVAPRWIAQGPDLVEWAASGKLATRPDRLVEGKALYRVLSQPGTRGVFLVGGGAVADAIFALAHVMASGGIAPAPGARRLIDLRDFARDAEPSQSWSGSLAALLDEAAQAADNVVLVLPTLLQTVWNPEWQQAYLNLLKAAWRVGNTRCLVPVEPLAYGEWIASDPDWRRLAQVMWIAAAVADAIPDEL